MTLSAQTRVQFLVPMASDSDSSFPNPTLVLCKIGVTASLFLVALTVKGVDVCQAFHDTPGLGFRLNTVSGSGAPDVGAMLPPVPWLFPVNYLGYSIGTPNPGLGLRQWPSCRGWLRSVELRNSVPRSQWPHSKCSGEDWE